MTSTKTQLPYDYYDLPVHCKPETGAKYKSENLGKNGRFIQDERSMKISSRRNSSWRSNRQYEIQSNTSEKQDLTKPNFIISTG